MSRHLWNASRPKPADSSRRQAEPHHPSIFAATLRAVKGLTGQSASDKIVRLRPREVDLPVPRPASEDVEPPPPATTEEITQEIPRYNEMEPTEPALTMLSRGRHGLMW